MQIVIASHSTGRTRIRCKGPVDWMAKNFERQEIQCSDIGYDQTKGSQGILHR